MTRVGVIGGGAAGLSAAVHAAQFGAEVVVFERKQPGAESTGASAGVFTTSYRDRLAVQLRVRSKDILDAWRARLEIPYTANGFLRLAHSDSQAQHLADAAEQQAHQGVADAVVLSPSECHRRFPDLRTDDLAAALWSPHDGYTDGHILCSVWADWLRESGHSIRRAAIVGCDRADNHRLHLSTGEVEEVDAVVIAAGAWAKKVADLFGVHLTVVPERHQVCFVKLPEPLPYVMPTVMDYVPGADAAGLYFRQEGPQRLLVGLHSNEPGAVVADPDNFDRGCDPAFVEAAGAALIDRLPGLADAGLQPGYAGLYPYSSDGLPVVGPLQGDPTIVACAGGGGVGVNLAPIMGQLAAEYVLRPSEVPAALETEFVAALHPQRSMEG